MDAKRRAAVLPLYLLFSEDPARLPEIVSLMSPRRQEAPGAASFLVARVRERVCELHGVALDELRSLGRPVHVRPEEEGRMYRRISASEAAKLRADNLRVSRADQVAGVG